MKYALKVAETTIAGVIKEARLQKRLRKARVTLSKPLRGFTTSADNILHKEARSHHLALGFLRGRTMDEMERPLRAPNQGHISSRGLRLTQTVPDWQRVEQLVRKHGKRYFDNEQALLQSFAEFRDSWTVVNVA